VQYTESRESVKYRTQQISRIIVNVKESCQVVEELLQAGQPIGFDGEGVNLGPKGKLKSCIFSLEGNCVSLFFSHYLICNCSSL
jgi:hypothetical protein